MNTYMHTYMCTHMSMPRHDPNAGEGHAALRKALDEATESHQSGNVRHSDRSLAENKLVLAWLFLEAQQNSKFCDPV